MSKNQAAIKTLGSLMLLLAFTGFTIKEMWTRSGNYYHRADSVRQQRYPPDYPGAGIIALFYLFNSGDDELQLACNQARKRIWQTGDLQYRHIASPLKDSEVRELLVERIKKVWQTRYGLSEQQTRVLIYQGCDWVVFDLYNLYGDFQLVFDPKGKLFLLPSFW